MKINIFKSFAVFLLTLIVILILIVIYDLANYDSSYINKNSLTFSINNLNSKKTKKLFKYYENLYQATSYKIFKNREKYLKLEDSDSRINLPKTKVIPMKKNGFFPGRKIEDIEKNFSNWPRSHGGFSSMRFSSLDLINKNNIEKLQLAWTFNSKDGRKGIEANPVVYEGLVYVPTPGNHIVCLDGTNGEEIWSYKLPYIGSAPPTSYEINGEQYIIIPATGGITLKVNYGDLVELGDAVVAFKIQ